MTTKSTPMMSLDGGQFLMGSDRHYPEEAPARIVEVAPFQIDTAAVTNDAFAAFVAATGYITTSERPNDKENKVAGSFVFQMTKGPVSLLDPNQWWQFVPGANWRHPEGPQSNLVKRGLHPVVNVSFIDALAYANWAGKSLPSEAQWEFAATIAASDRLDMNIWRGDFPHRNERTGMPPFTVPSRNNDTPRSRLHNMLGNVWEWTTDPFSQTSTGRPNCCVPEPQSSQDTRILKGGSYLCAESYCRRYRPAARIAHAETSATSHIGFRCVAG
ncbi:MULTISPECIES: formylglycine-generating enzyme family protein [Rhodobacterales]|uniref:formylglycine-generating enzyme family protein n=1 Tax=Rhodobacterales TaxID=204455 RepID=UPI003297C3EB